MKFKQISKVLKKVKKKSSRFFTIIEVLVVISIIGIISGLVIINQESTRALARDKKRIADLAAYQGALQEYYSQHKEYPINPGPNACIAHQAGCLKILEDEDFLTPLSKDPLSQDPDYHYLYGENATVDGKEYRLAVRLERDTRAMARDGGSDVALYEVFSTLGSHIAISYTGRGITKMLSCDVMATDECNFQGGINVLGLAGKTASVDFPYGAHSQLVGLPWLEGWEYRKPVIIDNTGGPARSNYQVEIDTTHAVYHENGLVGSWHLNEGSGIVASDMSGDRNTGTLFNGPTWVDGKFGKALSFDGVNDYVSVPHSTSLNITNAITLEVWIKADNWAPNDYDRPFVTKASGADWGVWNLVHKVNDAPTGKTGFRFEIVISGTRYKIWSTTQGQINQWYHVVGTFDGTTMRLYVNGIEESSSVHSGSINTNSLNLQIGKQFWYGSTYSYFDGLIDEVRIYDRALRPSEILALFNASKARLDYGDIRFTDENGTDLLPYWQESDIKAWVKVPSIPANSKKTIYLYYGNPSVNSESSVINTFNVLLSENMENPPAGTLDGSAAYDATNKWLRLTKAVGSQLGHLSYQGDLTTGFVAEFIFWTGGTTGCAGDAVWMGSFDTSVATTTEDVVKGGYHFTYDELQNRICFTKSTTDNGNGISCTAQSGMSDSGWHQAKVVYQNGCVKIYFGGVLKVDACDSAYSSYKSGFGNYFSWGGRTGGCNNEHRVDDLIVRELPLTGPITRILNSEQTQYDEYCICCFGPPDIGADCTATNNILILNLSDETNAHAQEVIDLLTGWRYRTLIRIDNTGGNVSLINYQVLITLDTASLISDGKMLADCADIRFADSDGFTNLNYYIEPGTCNTNNTRIWTRVPLIPANSVKTIYVYYGNSAATGQSDASVCPGGIHSGFCTEFFDDFSSGIGQWTVTAYDPTTTSYIGYGQCPTSGNSVYWELVGGELHIHSSSFDNTYSGTGMPPCGYRFTTTNSIDADSFIIQIRGRYAGLDYTVGQMPFLSPWIIDGYGENWGIGYILFKGNYVSWEQYVNSGYSRIDIPNSLTATNNWEYVKLGNNIILDSSGTYDPLPILENVQELERPFKISLNSYASAMDYPYGTWQSIRYDSYWDSVLVRKYANPVPETSIGREEKTIESDTYACLSAAPVRDIICTYRTLNCNADETTFCSLSFYMNAHIGGKNKYDYKVCCKITL